MPGTLDNKLKLEQEQVDKPSRTGWTRMCKTYLPGELPLYGLMERVYDKEEVIYIENCRRVLYIQSQSHVKKFQEHGAVKISGLHLKSFR